MKDWDPATDPDKYDIWTLIALLSEANQSEYWDTRVGDIRRHLERGANPNAGRFPPLVTAADMGHLSIVEVLLEYGADVNGGHKYHTPLVGAQDHPAIKACLLRHGATETVFTAVAEGNLQKIKTFVEADTAMVDVRDERDMTPLFLAADTHHLPAMRYFLDAGADPNAVAEATYGVSPIHQVCRGGPERDSRKAIEILVQHGADLDARDKGGVTALHMAVRDRNVEAVRGLLELGASVDIEDRGRKSTPLRRAVANTGKPGTSGKTEAAVEITKLLLDFGADPNHINRSGKSMIESSRNPTIRSLLAASAAAAKKK